MSSGWLIVSATMVGHLTVIKNLWQKIWFDIISWCHHHRDRHTERHGGKWRWWWRGTLAWICRYKESCIETQIQLKMTSLRNSISEVLLCTFLLTWMTELLNDQFSHIYQHDKIELSYIFCRRLVDGYRFGKVLSRSSFDTKYCDTTAATAADSDTTSATTTHTVNKLGLFRKNYLEMRNMILRLLFQQFMILIATVLNIFQLRQKGWGWLGLSEICRFSNIGRWYPQRILVTYKICFAASIS